MSEQPHIPVEQPAHPMARKVGAVLAPTVLLLGNNMPGVGHETRTVESINAEHHVVVDEVPASLPSNPVDAKIVIRNVDNEYRSDFQTTEQDAESSENQVANQLQEVLGDDGWAQVYDIQVTGESSADDEHPGGGFQEPSEANTNLALQRALLTAKPVVEAFAAKGIDVHQQVEKKAGEPAEEMIQARGIEDSWSDEDLAAANSLAEQFGYESVETMAEHYNDDNDAVPPAVAEFFGPLLDDHQGSEIVLSLRGADGADQQVMVRVTRDEVTVRRVTRDTEIQKIVNNQTVGKLNEQEGLVTEEPGADEKKPPQENPVVQPPVVVTETTPPPTDPPEQPPRPWEEAPKDAMFRQRQRAPQGNGAKPLRHGGGVPYNPTPSNFAR